jgi:micrococcal nuclease
MKQIKTKARMAIACSLVCAVILGSVGAYFLLRKNSAHTEAHIDPETAYPVVSVIDGDTFTADVGGKTITVRALGIDTPETVDPRKPVQCYGPEASVEAKHMLGGAHVRLLANPDRERRDRYGRYLLYVYRSDGLFYNRYMIENGFAREYTFGHESYQHQNEFRSAEAMARSTGRGLWKVCEKGGKVI